MKPHLRHLATHVLLAGTVNVLLDLLGFRCLDTVHFLSFLERILVCLYILCGLSLCQLEGGAGRTNRLCLIFSFCSLIRVIRAVSSSSLNLSYNKVTNWCTMHNHRGLTYPLRPSGLHALWVNVRLLFGVLLSFRCR